MQGHAVLILHNKMINVVLWKQQPQEDIYVPLFYQLLVYLIYMLMYLETNMPHQIYLRKHD